MWKSKKWTALLDKILAVEVPDPLLCFSKLGKTMFGIVNSMVVGASQAIVDLFRYNQDGELRHIWVDRRPRR
jgi:hypothetical protein